MTIYALDSGVARGHEEFQYWPDTPTELRGGGGGGGSEEGRAEHGCVVCRTGTCQQPQRVVAANLHLSTLALHGSVAACVLTCGDPHQTSGFCRTVLVSGRGRYDFVDGDADASDCDGHGSHVASTAAGRSVGVARGSRLVAVRVLDCHGTGAISDTVAGGREEG